MSNVEKTGGIIWVLEDIIARAKSKVRSNNLRNELVWNVVTALRGLDAETGDEVVKNLTTGRIRGVLGLSSSNFLVVRESNLSCSELLLRDEALVRAPYHFQIHYRTAVPAIRVLYDWDLEKEEPYRSALQYTGLTRFQDALVQFLRSLDRFFSSISRWFGWRWMNFLDQHSVYEICKEKYKRK